MKHTATFRRLSLLGTLGFLLAIAIAQTPSALTADTTAPTLMLRPHCATGVSPCPTFDVLDPDTLRTSPMNKGDNLHMDLVVLNPGKRKISRVRAWIQFNASVLEGAGISAGDLLPTAVPGELAFSPSDGLIKIDVSAVTDQEPTGETIEVARMLLNIKSIPQTNSDVLSFYDVQVTGHTRIVAKKDNGESEDILTQVPGSLLIDFSPQQNSSSSAAQSNGNTSSASTDSQSSIDTEHPAAGSSTSTSTASATSSNGVSLSSISSSFTSMAASSSVASATPICGNGLLEAGEECDDGNFLAEDGCSVNCTLEIASSSSAPVSSVASMSSTSNGQPDGTTCGSHADCNSGLCGGGVCRGDILKVEDGGACNTPIQCLSGNCTSNRCSVASSSVGSTQESGTAFTQLQVRNMRITTEGTSLYVAWDPLVSSKLKAYNLYYGTTSGRYIQRKTVSAESTSMAIRSLPEKTTYFVAIRALNQNDEESAFSQEVAVEVGNPKTSTAPLTGDLLKTKNPVTVPGETGIPSIFALILTLSAITGTVLASRRQVVALAVPPRSR